MGNVMLKLLVWAFISLPLYSFGQVENFDITVADTIIANHYFKKADSLSRSAQYDSAIYYFQKASVIYKKVENREKYVSCYNQTGRNFTYKTKYEEAISSLNIALDYGLKKQTQFILIPNS